MRAVAVLLCVSVAACGSKKAAPLAELVKADGPVDKQTGNGDWGAAAVGTGFFLNDAARTADGGAQLTITGASIAMQPRTVLRFGAAAGSAGGSRISVELGAIDLTGTGSYTLDVGDVKLGKGGAVRVTARGHGESEVELTAGEGQVTTNGQTLDLAVGKKIELSLDIPDAAGDAAKAPAVDAPPPPPDAPPPPPIPTDSTVVVTGKKVEMQEAGAKDWKVLEGTANIPVGAKVRVGAGSTAKVTSGGATVDMQTGGRIEIESDLAIGIEAGTVKATAPQNGAAKLIVPGGGVGLKGSPESSAETRIEIGRETKVTVLRANAKLTGASGAELEMSRGESATIAKSGVIHPIEAIPTYVDFKFAVGETATIHDPKGATAVQFQFGGKCGAPGGVIELDRDTRFRSAKLSAGKDAANLMVTGGGWSYRLRCSTAGGDEGTAVASGRISVVADSGTRALPKKQPDNDIDADGRIWRISYQSVIPNLHVLYKGPSGSKFKLHVASAGKEDTFDGTQPKIAVPGTKLHEGTFTYWFDRDGEKDPKVSTLKIDFDQTAPQVYIEAPADRAVWNGDIEVRGAVLSGWTAAVDSITIPIDGQRRFGYSPVVKVPPPAGQNALAIKLSHPQRGVHYYLRRPK